MGSAKISPAHHAKQGWNPPDQRGFHPCFVLLFPNILQNLLIQLKLIQAEMTVSQINQTDVRKTVLFV